MNYFTDFPMQLHSSTYRLNYNSVSLNNTDEIILQLVLHLEIHLDCIPVSG